MGAAHVGTGFWDQYRINSIRFTIASNNNAIGLVTNANIALVPLYCVIDYDDSSLLGSVAAAEAYSNCICLNPGESLERVFKPRMAVSAYNGAFGAFANVPDMWIDAASTSVQHYGIKTVVPPALLGQTQLQTWDVVVEYFVELRKAI
jgi:hypothetical protein